MSEFSNDYAASMVAALRVEREGYVERGLKDRIQQVDKQLAAFGAEPVKAAKKDSSDAGSAKETAAQRKAREKAEAEQAAAEAKAAAEAQAAFDALSDEDKAALEGLSADDLAALAALSA